MLLLHWRLSSLSRFGRLHWSLRTTAKVAASCTAGKHHILLTPFPTGDISFARDKVSNLQYRARRMLEEPVVEKSNFRLFKKVQMPGAREIDEREAYLLIRWSEAIERNEAGGPFSTAR
jgi:hypothetical protein